MRTREARAVIVHLEEIDRVIGRLFSPELAADGEVARAAAVPMRRWVPRQVSLEELSESLQDALFGALSRQTGGSMWYRRGEEMRRITTASLAQAADALMGLLFERLPESLPNYELVRDWAQSTGSLGALKCLSTERFSACRPAGEQQFMRWAYENRLREEGISL